VIAIFAKNGSCAIAVIRLLNVSVLCLDKYVVAIFARNSRCAIAVVSSCRVSKLFARLNTAIRACLGAIAIRLAEIMANKSYVAAIVACGVAIIIVGMLAFAARPEHHCHNQGK
jgi:hypothetical protein